MSLRDRTPEIKVGGRRQRVEEILDELDPEDRVVLDGWLRDLRYAPYRIAVELRAEGFPVSEGAIASYRKNVLKMGDRKR